MCLHLLSSSSQSQDWLGLAASQQTADSRQLGLAASQQTASQEEGVQEQGGYRRKINNKRSKRHTVMTKKYVVRSYFS